MQNSLQWKICCVLVAVTYLIAVSPITEVALAQFGKVTVPSGTRVPLAFAETVDPQFKSMGDRVALRVTNDVRVDGKVVIEAGASAFGEVTVANKKGNIGKAAEVGVVLKYVTAVDGTEIPLSAQKYVKGQDKVTTAIVVAVLLCILGLLIKGGDASITEGTTLEANTTTSMDVDAG
jgi:hypothetical protein